MEELCYEMLPVYCDVLYQIKTSMIYSSAGCYFNPKTFTFMVFHNLFTGLHYL